VATILAFFLALQAGDKKGEEQLPLPPTIKVPPAPVVPPEEALKTIRVAPGFRIELVAHEPLVRDPVVARFDADGRLWVVEMLGYMPDLSGKGEEAPVGEIAVLEDGDGDGRFDRRRVFLDKLVLPRAIAFAGDGVLVAEPPSLWFCRDKDGDGRADEKTMVVPNYASLRVVEHTANGLLRAIDNWIYSANGPIRLRRQAGQWLQGATRSRGQWGLAQDDWGRLLYNSNPEILRGDLVPCYNARAHLGRDPATNVAIVRDQTLWPARVNAGVNRGYQKGVLRADGTLAATTASCSPLVYRGAQFPDEFRGNVFTCDPAANLVRRSVLAEEDGKITGRSAYEKSEFLASTDERFRPVHLEAGPDGCLYVVDMYRGVIQHKLYMTSFLRSQILSRDLEKPIGLGRIYRVVHESRPPAKPARLSRATATELASELSSPDGWRRDTAQRLLVDRGDVSIAGELRRLLLTGTAPVPRLHALFALEGLRQIDAPTLELCLKDPDPRIRFAAESIREGSDPLGAVVSAAGSGAAVADAAVAGKELDLLERIMASEDWEKEEPARAAFLTRLGERVAAAGRPEEFLEFLDRAAAQSNAARWRQRALLVQPGKPIGLPARPLGLGKLRISEDEAVRRAAERLFASLEWPGKTADEPLPPRAKPLSAEEQARWERGRRQFTASCVACHLHSGLGDEAKGPPLVDSDWVLGSERRLVRILANGLHGSLRVSGKWYTFAQEMPALINMSNTEMAEVLTYIRREWGHQAPPVDVATVRKIREEVDDRETPWTEKELLDIPE
jgi:glucose/arabinose dehydrogenase/mono/diheme cytochrome c family protein